MSALRRTGWQIRVLANEDAQQDRWSPRRSVSRNILHAMSWLEFVAELVSALAWPITIVAALVFLRRPLERWMRERPSRIKAGPVELEWDSLGAMIRTCGLALGLVT
jgi:hypothetical protein